jgi:hypothetical protein
MKKIPTIFERDWEGDRSRVLDKPNPEAAWVFDGEGVATRKYDGMACMYDGHRWYKRREIKRADVVSKGLPDGFIEADRDELTAKIVGWIPIGGGPEDRYLVEATHRSTDEPTPGTYEFLGPKSQGNVEAIESHTMQLHAECEPLEAPRTFDGLRAWLDGSDIEGIVWHHPDGRMAKIKLRDFGLKRRKETAP